MLTPTEEVLQHIKLPFELSDYQVEDIDRFSLVDASGLYLDPGLGKTVMGVIIGCYKLLHGFESVMTIVPASLITQWVEFLTELELDFVEYRDTPKGREKISFEGAEFIVMSPEIYRKDHDRMIKLENMYYVVDEATVLCNKDNVLYKMLRGGVRKEKTHMTLASGFKMPVTKNTQYPRLMTDCCLMTGTPINSPLDAYGLIAITSPGRYVNYQAFYRYHVAEEDKFGRPTEFTRLDEINDALTENASLREITDHLDLPEKIYRIIKYDLTPDHMALYKKLVEEQILVLKDGSIIDATQANVMYHLCQKFVFCPVEFTGKIEGLEVLDTLVADTRQRIIFNKHVAVNDLVMDRYDAGGCYGKVGRKDQDAYIKAFKAGELDTITANPKSGGVGLNLQICNQVIFSELPLTSRDLRQSEARVWRRGQENPVVITLMVARKTIQATLLSRVLKKDDVSVKTLHSKSSLRDDLMGAGE
jgi:SNF2 family DNA or RNA helicase